MLIFMSEDGSFEWHVGEKLPVIEKVIRVTADGDELEFIHDNFANIPFRGKMQAVTWPSPWAEFIYQNLWSCAKGE